MDKVPETLNELRVRLVSAVAEAIGPYLGVYSAISNARIAIDTLLTNLEPPVADMVRVGAEQVWAHPDAWRPRSPYGRALSNRRS
jgi:hypothetical protein